MQEIRKLCSSRVRSLSPSSFSKVNIHALATEGHLGEFVGLQPVRGLEVDSISNNITALAVIYKYFRLTRKCMFFLPFLFIDHLGLR